MAPLTTLDPILLPTPRQLTRREGFCPTTDPQVARDSSIAAQGYHLALRPDGIRISHLDAAGLRNARATLAQLQTQYGAQLPCLEIDDAPAFAVRGVMLDVSRNRIPTMPELLKLIDQLASWKINHLQLYVEHTFAYSQHPLAWQGWDPLTHDEVRQLVTHAAGLGVEIAANQNCLGHLEGWFEHPQYAALAEMAPGQPWKFGSGTKTGPFSLCPSDPTSLPLITGLLDELLPLFPAHAANIGCDESFDLGQGRSHALVAERGKAAVYMDWVQQVCAVVRRHGKRPLFWADIALEHPEALDQLPEDLVSLCWGYEPNSNFSRWLEQIRSRGREAWVCPGTACWRTWTGRTMERRGNLLAAAEQGIASGASGYLATAWGDLGHRQPWPVTLHALAEAAHRAWSGAAHFDARASSLHAFTDRSLETGPWIDAFGDVDLSLRRTPEKGGGVLRNASALFTDFHRPWDELTRGTRGTGADYAACAGTLDGLLRSMPSNDPLVAEELSLGGHWAQLAATIGFTRRTTPNDTTTRRMFADMVTAFTQEHRRLWLKRARPGGLERSCAQYATVAKNLIPT